MKVLTEKEWIEFYKKKGFSLFKTKPTVKKLRKLFKIQDLVKGI